MRNVLNALSFAYPDSAATDMQALVKRAEPRQTLLAATAVNHRSKHQASPAETGPLYFLVHLSLERGTT